MTYNKIRCLELLRRFLDLRNQGKDLDRENRNEYMELLHYRGRLEDPAGNNLNGLFDHRIGSLKENKEGRIYKIKLLIISILSIYQSKSKLYVIQHVVYVYSIVCNFFILL